MATPLTFTTVIGWLYDLFVYYFIGDAFLAGVFGGLILLLTAVSMNLGSDSLIALAIYSSALLGVYALSFNPTIFVAIAIALGIIVPAALALMKR